MFRRGKLILFFLLFTLAIFSGAGAEEVLTWQECVQEAKWNNPSLISAAEELKKAQADKAISRSQMLPQISSSLSRDRKSSVTRAATTSTSTSSATSTATSRARRVINDSYSYSVNGQQLLFDGFKSLNDVSAASRTLKAAQYDYAVVSSNIRLELRESFVELLKAQELLSLTEDIAKRRQENLKLVKVRYDAGREHKGALLTAEADLAQAEFEVAQARRNIVLSQRKLTREMGRGFFSPFRADGEFSVYSGDREMPDFEYLADNTPFLNELIAKKQSAEYSLASAKAEFFPRVYLDTSIGKTASAWPPGDREWTVGMSISFPLFEGGSRIAGVTRARALLNQAEADERGGRDEVVFVLAQTWTDLQDAIDELSVREKFLLAARERAKIANAQYSSGLISFDDWIIIEDELVNARKSFLNAEAEVLIRDAYWVQAKGGTLDYAQE